MLAAVGICLLAGAVARTPSGDPLRAAAEYIASRQYERAAEMLEKVIRLPQAPPDAFLMLVDCRMRRGEFEAALAAARAGLEKHPDSPLLLITAGRLLLRDRQLSASARDLLAKAAQLEPGNPETHYYYSQWACLHNQEDLCIREAEAALKLSGDNPQAELQLNALIGIAAEKLDRPAEAEAAYKRSLAANRKLGLADPLSAYRYVDFLVKRARDDEAESLVDDLIRRAPRFGPAQLERAKFLAKKGEQQQALALAEKSLTMEDMDKDAQRAAHMLLARIYFLLGREDDAARHQAWIEQNPH